MCDLYVRDIISVCHGNLLCGDVNLKLGRVVIDTRIIEKDDVYVGLCGEVVNGSDFWCDAIKGGASVCILNKMVDVSDIDCTIVVVEDTLVCLQELAKYKRSLMNIPVVAITGSVGKTSTKDMVASVIGTRYSVYKTLGNYNNHIGVPLTILGYSDEEVLVVEMGMNHLGEISVLSNIAQPTICVITNVGTAHIGNLGSRENILKAKLEILEGMKGKDVVINYDNDMLYGAYDKLKDDYLVSRISIDNDSEYKAFNIKAGVFESQFDIDGVSSDICVNVGGRVFVYNALVAYAVGCILHIDDKDIKKGIKNFKLSSHRLEKKISHSGITIIDDTYNANFDSMKSSIELLGGVKDRRRIAVLGDMLELGEYSSELHRNLGDIVIHSHIDVLITVGSESLEIDKRVIELGMNKDRVIHFDKEDESYSFLKSYLNKNDVVLVKGSHGIHLLHVVDEIVKM